MREIRFEQDQEQEESDRGMGTRQCARNSEFQLPTI